VEERARCTFPCVKLIYKPFGILFGILAGLLSKNIFEWIWSKFDDEKPPKPTTRDTPTSKVLAAAAVQGVTFKVTRAAVDRAGARGYEHLTGVWPGQKVPDPD
jgi:Protein of unknown function (DUF4235)